MSEQQVPRVAQSIDDLRTGQVVVCHDGTHMSVHMPFAFVGTIDARTASTARVNGRFTDGGESCFFVEPESISAGEWVILSDPPPEPVTVSREAFDRLAKAQADWDRDGINPDLRGAVIRAARALVDEGRAGE